MIFYLGIKLKYHYGWVYPRRLKQSFFILVFQLGHLKVLWQQKDISALILFRRRTGMLFFESIIADAINSALL